MSINFGTGGFRAVIGEDYNKENVCLISQAICNLIKRNNKKKRVCIGYDNRFMSENFARWCAEIFATNDIDVELCKEAVSTPVVMYATMVNDNDYGVMITASHNPYMYNGVKVFVKEGRDAGVADTKEIEQEINNIKFVPSINEEKLNKIVLCDYMEQYINNIVNLLGINNVENNLNVVYDAKYGSTVKELEMMSNKIGIKNYSIINYERDAFFGFKTPAPSIDNIEDLKFAVQDKKADIGFSLDADGDRLAVIDENNNYIDNNYILAIAYYFLVKYCGEKGGSVKNVATSNLLDIVTKNCGYECYEVPVGFKHISKGITDNNAVIGGESSGGLAIKGHIWGKDSLLAIALCLKAMLVMKKSFGEILNEVLTFANNYTKIIFDKQYHYTASQKQHIDNLLKQEQTPTHRYEVEKIVFDEHIKVYYKNGNWVLIRFSGTEPILRIFAEADSQEESIQLITDWEKHLGL